MTSPRWLFFLVMFLMALVAALAGCAQQEMLWGPGRCFSYREMDGTTTNKCYRTEDRMALTCEEVARREREQHGKIVLWCRE